MVFIHFGQLKVKPFCLVIFRTFFTMFFLKSVLFFPKKEDGNSLFNFFFVIVWFWVYDIGIHQHKGMFICHRFPSMEFYGFCLCLASSTTKHRRHRFMVKRSNRWILKEIWLLPGTFFMTAILFCCKLFMFAQQNGHCALVSFSSLQAKNKEQFFFKKHPKPFRMVKR